MTPTSDPEVSTGAPATGPQALGATEQNATQDTGWAVTVELDAGPTVDDDHIDPLMGALAGRSGALSLRHPADGDGTSSGGVVVAMTFDVTDAEDPDTAGAAALTIARDALAAAGLPVTGEVLELSVLTWAEQKRRNRQPVIPDLLGVSEVVDMLAVTRQRVDQLRARPDSGFPAPVAVLRAGPIWTAPAIRAFLKTWDRSPGRRPRTKTAAATP